MNNKDAIKRLQAMFQLCITTLITEGNEYGREAVMIANSDALTAAIDALERPDIVMCKECALRATDKCVMRNDRSLHSWDYCSWGVKENEEG